MQSNRLKFSFLKRELCGLLCDLSFVRIQVYGRI